MNYAIILAGGRGHRMAQDIPKQFLNVNNKPIIIHTLDRFQNHPKIDSIVVVCLEGWKEVLKAYSVQSGIDKLKWVISGGTTGQESIRNGVVFLKDKACQDDVIVIHDGIRPIVDEEVISDVIRIAQEKGNAVTSMPFREQMFVVNPNQSSTERYIPRETLRRVSTPQAYKYDLLLEKYQEAFERNIGISGSSYTNTMMVELGVTLNFALGSERNIKLTTKDDLDLFKSYLKALKRDDRY